MPSIIVPTPVDLDKPRTVLFTREAVFFLELDLTRLWGREYTFFEAVRRLSEMLLDNDFAKLSYVNIAYLLWRGCQHEDATLTLAQVEAALPYADPSGLIPYAGIVLQAWQAASPVPVPIPDGSEVADTDPLAVSPGRPSGALSGSASA